MQRTAIAGVLTRLSWVRKKAGPRKPIDCMIWRTIEESLWDWEHQRTSVVKRHVKMQECLAFRTDVIERPLLTRVSAIQPPTLANTAMVNHGKTHRSPDSVRLNFKTWQNVINWNYSFLFLFVKKDLTICEVGSTCLIVISGHPCQEYERSPIMAEVGDYESPDRGLRQNQLPWNDGNRFPWFATSEYNLLFFFT